MYGGDQGLTSTLLTSTQAFPLAQHVPRAAHTTKLQIQVAKGHFGLAHPASSLSGHTATCKSRKFVMLLGYSTWHGSFSASQCIVRLDCGFPCPDFIWECPCVMHRHSPFSCQIFAVQSGFGNCMRFRMRWSRHDPKDWGLWG